MKKRRVVNWVLISLVVAVLVTGGVLYMMASKVPEDYRPVVLTEARKQEARESLAAKVKDFIRLAGEIGSEEPDQVATTRPGDGARPQKKQFKMSLSQDEVNEWTATMNDKLSNTLKEFGMSDPAVAIGKDRLTFYARWAEYDKVVGLDMGFRFNSDSTMTIDIKKARIGDLPMPKASLEKHKAAIVDKLERHVREIGGDGGGSFAGQPMGLFNDAASKMADAMAGRPVKLDIRQSFGNVRVRGIAMVDGQATLDVVALPAENDQKLDPADESRARGLAGAASTRR